MSKRILLDARYLDGSFSGIGTYSRQVIEHLSAIDQETQYYVLVHPGLKDPLAVGKNFEVLSHRARPVSVPTLTSLGRLMDALRLDVVHSLFPLAPLRLRTPLAVTLHDLQPLVDPDFSARRIPFIKNAYNMFYRTVYPAVMEKAKWVFCVSYYTRDLTAELFPELIPRLVVVPSGLDARYFNPPSVSVEEVRRQFNISRPYLLYYGSTRPNKNLPRTLRAFAQYLRASDDHEIELVFVLKRDRFFKEIRHVLRIEQLADRVRFLDQVPPEHVRALLAGARAFLFASKHEGFGFPSLEAMAAGVPVLAGRSGALPEICGNAAEFVDPDSTDDMAKGIERLLTDEPRRQELIERGKVRARQFDWKETAERLHSLYQLLF